MAAELPGAVEGAVPAAPVARGDGEGAGRVALVDIDPVVPRVHAKQASAHVQGHFLSFPTALGVPVPGEAAAPDGVEAAREEPRSPFRAEYGACLHPQGELIFRAQAPLQAHFRQETDAPPGVFRMPAQQRLELAFARVRPPAGIRRHPEGGALITRCRAAVTLVLTAVPAAHDADAVAVGRQIEGARQGGDLPVVADRRLGEEAPVRPGEARLQRSAFARGRQPGRRRAPGLRHVHDRLVPRQGIRRRDLPGAEMPVRRHPQQGGAMGAGGGEARPVLAERAQGAEPAQLEAAPLQQALPETGVEMAHDQLSERPLSIVSGAQGRST